MANYISRLFSSTEKVIVAPAIASLLLALGSTVTAQELDINYGVDFTTNYISKGFTQSDDDPAVQPYVEFSYGSVYLELWASNASFGGDKDIEYDVGVGYRPELGDLELDIGFVQYFYRDDKTNYGEAYAFGNYDLTDQTSLGFKYYREVYADQDWLYLQASQAGLPWDLTISGGVGTDFGSRNLSETAVSSDIGLTKDFGDHTAFDVRAHYNTDEGARLLATLSFFN